MLAKTALLNLFYKLSVMKPVGRRRNWFSYVRRILSIDQERIIAEVQPGMAEAVKASRNTDEYKSAMASNHCNNFPKAYSAPCDDMFAIKSKEDKGNVQITLAPSTNGTGRLVLLLDADIDESGKALAHLMDVLKHKFTGGRIRSTYTSTFVCAIQNPNSDTVWFRRIENLRFRRCVL